MTQRFGRYDLMRPLGRGGMAEVFLARYVGPEGFEKRLVIKRLLPELVRDRRLLSLFFEEARTHAALSHGNLVPVFDFGRVGNSHFIAMELVVGQDLYSLLDRLRSKSHPLPLNLVAYIGIEVARGLGYVHRKRLVHRDVAPRNILLSVDGEVKLSDFGIALAVDDAAAASICGTLAYIAPEAARGEAIDGRADLYSLGVVLAEAVLGQRVRPSADPERALEQARTAEPVDVPGPLHDILARLTQADPARRFATGEELQLALEQVAQAEGGVASAARQLAALVEAPTDGDPAIQSMQVAPFEAAVTAPTLSDVSTLGAPDPDAQTATYFLGRKSDETFVKEVLDAPAPTMAAGRARWGATILFAAALVVLGVVLQAVRPARPQPSQRVPTEAGPAVTTGSPPVAPPASPTITPLPQPVSPTAKPTPHASAVSAPESRLATAPVLVRCTPWCELLVDGKVRGADGRTHQLTLPSGRHQLTVRRLDDRQERAIVLRGGEPTTIDFTFE